MNILQGFITVLTPIIVAWFGYRQTKSQKQSDEYIKLRDKYESEQEKSRKEEVEQQKKQFEEFGKSLQELQKQVKAIQDSQTTSSSKVEQDLVSLVNMSNVNFEYCQSLSRVVGTIGEALGTVDSVDEEVITKAIEKHKDDEQSLIRRIYKISY